MSAGEQGLSTTDSGISRADGCNRSEGHYIRLDWPNSSMRFNLGDSSKMALDRAQTATEDSPLSRPAVSGRELVLCVDAGGSSCKAALLSDDGILASSVGEPCNV